MLSLTAPSRRIPSGLAMLCLSLSLTACVTVPVPPKQYLADCTVTYLGAEPASNASLTRLALDREFDVRLCNVDKAALRSYYDGFVEACGWRCRKSKE